MCTLWAIVATPLSQRAVSTPTVIRAWRTRPTAKEVCAALESAMGHMCEHRKYSGISETLASGASSVRDYIASAQYTIQKINDCDELMERASLRLVQ